LQGFGFVQFHEEAAKQAALLLNESVLQEAQISVTPSRYSLVSPPTVVTSSSSSSNNEPKTGSNFEVDNTTQHNAKDGIKQEARLVK